MRCRCWILSVAVLAVVALEVGALMADPATKTSKRRLELRTATTDRPAAIVVRGLSETELVSIRVALKSRGQNDGKDVSILRVEVVPESGAAAGPMLGTQVVDGETLVFEPRFPFRPGLKYRAVLRLPSAREPETEFAFSLPALPRPAPARVTVVYPTSDVLPENQLKLYIQFSAPMSRGEVYDRVHLLDAKGIEIELPFVHVGEELWDTTGTRLTMLFEPGRIKRGLKPREEQGPILVEGNSYTLVIDREWPDASGNPMTESYRKKFRATAPDATQPTLDNWKLELPQAGTKASLVIRFPEPLDRAMLERVINIVDKSGNAIDGTVKVDEHEMRWSFEPSEAWKPGRYQLQVDTSLEDLAANSIAHPFEVDVLRPINRDVKSRTATRTFEIGSAAQGQK